MNKINGLKLMKMEYAIQVLEIRIEQLEEAYIKFVIKGGVKKTNPIAIINRNKIGQLEKAIVFLKTIKKN